MTDYTHVYCPGCKSIQEAIYDVLPGRDISGIYEGKDVVCTVCKLIVNTEYRLPGKSEEGSKPRN